MTGQSFKRMRGVRLAALVLGAALPLMVAAAARAETLADAMVSAYRNSHLLDQNRAVLRAADEDAATAIASLRPVIGWALNGAYSKSPRLGEGGTTTGALSLDWTVYDFGRSRAAIEIARETVLATREALVNVEQQVLLAAVTAFFDVKSSSENVALNQNSVRVIGEALKAARDRFDVGEVTRTDVSQAEASQAAARAQLAVAQGGLAAAREAYKAATGHYPGPLSGAPRAPGLPRSLPEAEAIAQRNHPLLRQAQKQVTVAELAIAAAVAQRNPTLDFSAQAALDDTGHDQSQVQLGLNGPIYTGGKLSSAHRRAIASRDQARAALLQSSVTVSQNVANAWANIAVARAQLGAIDQQIQAARSAYEGVREEATLGARTTLDVLDAEQALLDAEASRINAAANLQIAHYSLLAAMGLLTVEHLNLGIPTYDPAAYYNAVKNAPPTSTRGKSLDRVLRAIGKN